MATKKTKQAQEVVTSYKGFDKDLQCRGYQFAVGETYTHEGSVKACKGGFHACEYPLDVLGYYPPAGSRFALVEQSGDLSRDRQDTKLASSTIKISAEIGPPGLIKAAIEYTLKRALPIDPASPASATGDQGAAMASGYEGRVAGADGCALFLVERDDSYKIVAVWAGIVGREGIKPNAFYLLRNGKPVEV